MEQTSDKVGVPGWAESIGATEEEVRAAWEDLARRGLAGVDDGEATVSALAMRRATSDVQRRLASHLSGYLPTDNAYIVRRAGDPPGSPQILDTRIFVQYIANYFRNGWGVTAIEADLQILTRDEIEAAIQYYLNHRAEIEQDIQRTRDIYEAHVRARERIAA